MSFVSIWVHAVWGTKNREPVLEEDIREEICQHIIQNSVEKNFYIDSLDGHFDHLHSLMTLNPGMSISKQMQLIKGESSFWVNDNKLIRGHFEWADEYFAVSVSNDKLDKVREYIRNQKEHHKKITFLDEYNAFVKSLRNNDKKL
jgi:REP element-mobilizing transposase RayT